MTVTLHQGFVRIDLEPQNLDSLRYPHCCSLEIAFDYRRVTLPARRT